MKKLTKIVMLMMLTVLLAACGGGEKAEKTEPAEQSASSGEKLIVGLEAGFPPYEYLFSLQSILCNLRKNQQTDVSLLVY